MINHAQQLQTVQGSEKNSRRQGLAAEKHTPSVLRGRPPLRGTPRLWWEGVSHGRGGLPIVHYLSLSQEGCFGLWKYYVLFLPLGDRTNLKKKRVPAPAQLHTACLAKMQSLPQHTSGQCFSSERTERGAFQHLFRHFFKNDLNWRQ